MCSGQAITRQPDVTAPESIQILMAEDNEMNRMLVNMFTESLNCKIDTAVDGSEAVARATDKDYALILMDLCMPKLDGIQATHRIRQLLDKQKRPQPAIIAVTARSITGDRQRCLNAGMTDLIVKPFTKGELIAVILKHSG